MIRSSGSASNQEYDSVSAAATLVQSDGEESVGTTEYAYQVVRHVHLDCAVAVY
jgi:hypothetical protein